MDTVYVDTYSLLCTSHPCTLCQVKKKNIFRIFLSKFNLLHLWNDLLVRLPSQIPLDSVLVRPPFTIQSIPDEKSQAPPCVHWISCFKLQKLNVSFHVDFKSWYVLHTSNASEIALTHCCYSSIQAKRQTHDTHDLFERRYAQRVCTTAAGTVVLLLRTAAKYSYCSHGKASSLCTLL